MTIISYLPQHFDAVRKFASRVQVPILAHKRFVDYYYSTRDSSKLYLYLDGEDIVGTIGVELANFQYQGKDIVVGIASNFHVSVPGLGGYLFLRWVKTSPYSLEFGGSEAAHRIISHQGWTYFKGIKTLVLNYDYPAYPNNGLLSRGAKWILRRTSRKVISQFASRIPHQFLARFSVREEDRYEQNLLPRQSPFAFRMVPSIDYLAWRYNLGLSFVRYRLFRVMSDRITLGYVILSDFPDRIVVAQSDGEDPAGLAYGTILSILEVARHDRTPRRVLLNSSHTHMQPIYEQFGFRVEPKDFSFALFSARAKVDILQETSQWLVNYDWCDQGLFDAIVPKNRTE